MVISSFPKNNLAVKAAPMALAASERLVLIKTLFY